MVSENEFPKNNLAFFTVRPTSDSQGYIGAVLVTDNRGIPQEFRCTHPVRPSLVQKALYGKNLESYISIELCGKPLLEAVATEPTVCLVEFKEMVELRELVSLPIVYLQKAGDTLAEAGPDRMEARILRPDVPPANFQPLSVSCHPRWERDFEQVRPVLEQACRYVDLIEPFERIATSVSILSQRDERFK